MKYSELEIGQVLPELNAGTINHNQIVKYAGASGDFNPIHHNIEFAQKVGLKGTIAHGMFIMAQIGRACIFWIEQRQVYSFGVKFKKMTQMGEIIVCYGKVKRKDDQKKTVTIFVEAKNTEGEVKASGDVVVSFSMK